MKDRIPAIIATTAAVIALIVAIALAVAHNTPDRTNPSPTPAPATPHKTLSVEEQEKLKNTAIRFEQRTREWGTDPNAATANTLAQTDTDTLLNTIRTPDTVDTNISDISTITPTQDAGPAATSEACTQNPSGTACTTWPDMLSWWRAHHWTMGARLDGQPKATVNANGTVDVTGRVRIILWTSGLDATRIVTRDNTAWWAYTPVTGLVDYHDTLTITDGLVSKRQTHTPTTWLADPILSAWDTDPAAATMSWPERSQPSIPIQGDTPVDPDGLSPDPDHMMVANLPGTDGTLWDAVPDVNTRYGTDAPQQDPSWNPEDDAATLKEREAQYE